MGRHFLLFLLKIAFRIDCSAESAVSIRDPLKHCYIFIFCIFGRDVILGLEFLLLFPLFFLVVYLDLRYKLV